MSFEQVHNLNLLLGAGAILLQVVSIAVIILLFVAKKNFILDFIHKNANLLAFLVAGSAAIFSSIYSEIVGFVPCYLCWWARVLMFPLVLIFGAGLYHKDENASRYAWPFVFAGMALAVYHNVMYYFADTGNIPCDASGVSCFQELVSVFNGYISIPMLSLTSVIGVLVILLVKRYYKY